MTIVCAVCKKEIDSIHLDEKLAIPDLLNSLTTHLLRSHREDHDMFVEDVKQASEILASIPAYVLIDRFVDLDSEKTSQPIKNAAEKIDEGISHLGEILFDSEDEEEVEQEQPIENVVEIVAKS